MTALRGFEFFFWFSVVFSLPRSCPAAFPGVNLSNFGPQNARQQRVVDAFLHGWEGYRSSCWGWDEVRPVSKNCTNDLGGLGAQIVDTLDTLLLMGLDSEYAEAKTWVRDHLKMNLNKQVSVFETTIRIVGGLLSAFHLDGEAYFLDLAKDLGGRLLSAWREGPVPFELVNLATGQVGANEPILGSSLAEVGTIQMEFTSLSASTGDPRFRWRAEHVMESLGPTLEEAGGLLPIMLRPTTPLSWTNMRVTLGGRGDSFYEYLLKQWLMTNRTDERYRRWYHTSVDGIRRSLVSQSSPSNFTFVREVDHYKELEVLLGNTSLEWDPRAQTFPAFGVMMQVGGADFFTRAQSMLQQLQALKKVALGPALKKMVLQPSKSAPASSSSPRKGVATATLSTTTAPPPDPHVCSGGETGTAAQADSGNDDVVEVASAEKDASQGEGFEDDGDDLAPEMYHEDADEGYPVDEDVGFDESEDLDADEGSSDADYEEDLNMEEILHEVEEEFFDDADGEETVDVDDDAAPAGTCQAAAAEPPSSLPDNPLEAIAQLHQLELKFQEMARKQTVFIGLPEVTLEELCSIGELLQARRWDVLTHKVQLGVPPGSEVEIDQAMLDTISGMAGQELLKKCDQSSKFKMDHLACFLPGVLALGSMTGGAEDAEADLELAAGLAEGCAQMWLRTPTGLAPESATWHVMSDTEDLEVLKGTAHSILRPETVESLWYLYTATGDTKYQEWGWAIFEAIEKYATVAGGGFSGVDDVRHPHHISRIDRMETFVLSETFKYLFLLFGDASPYDLSRVVLNTEGHPLPVVSA